MFEKTTDLMFQVREGMDVYDRHGDKIGTVEFVTLGQGSPDLEDTVEMTPEGRERARERAARLRDVLDALDAAEHIPSDVREKMEQDGFIRMDAGIMRVDRYILPEQIVNIGPHDVVVRAFRDELLKA